MVKLQLFIIETFGTTVTMAVDTTVTLGQSVAIIVVVVLIE